MTNLLTFNPANLADRLVEARLKCEPIDRVDGLTKEQATQVKEAAIARLTEGDESAIVGYKVSLSRTWGALTHDVVVAGPARIERSVMIDPVFETEAIFLLDEDVGPNATLEQIVDCCRVCPGIEIADSRWVNWRLADRLKLRGPEIEADNGCSGWLVVGTDEVPARSLPLPDVYVTALVDGVAIDGGSLTHVFGHPAEAVRWLAQDLARGGRSLRAGQLVSTGNPYPRLVGSPPSGSTLKVAIDGVGSTSVTVNGSV